MTTRDNFVANFLNEGSEPVFATAGAKIFPGARVVRTRLLGPLSLGPRSQIGPDVVAGRYLGVNTDSYIARATIGSFCSFGSRVAINPLNHPLDWLSIHEFQYHQHSFDWDEEYRSVSKMPHCAPQNNPPVTIGNDVWISHNATIMEGIKIGDGAAVGAGAVVTKDVPPFAVVVGIPAQVKRYRFKDLVIERLLDLKWWELSLNDIRNVSFNNIEAALAEIETIRNERGVTFTSD